MKTAKKNFFFILKFFFDSQFIQAHSAVMDRAKIYEGYKDFNEWIMK
jgi:hypothetical protein